MFVKSIWAIVQFNSEISLLNFFFFGLDDIGTAEGTLLKSPIAVIAGFICPFMYSGICFKTSVH